MRQVCSALLALTVAVCGIGSAQAATAYSPIPRLFNTGVDALGVALPNGTIGDGHYTLFSVPAGSTANIRVLTSGYPIDPYFAGDTFSAWIGPNNDSQLNGPAGNYTYRTTFDLTGYDASTATISGGWSTDNNGMKILLNGIDTNNPGTGFTQFSTGFASFAIASGFVPGVNTLDFVVYNGGGPTALRVDMSGTAMLVPEPETYAMLLAGLGLMPLVAKRRGRTRS